MTWNSSSRTSSSSSKHRYLEFTGTDMAAAKRVTLNLLFDDHRVNYVTSVLSAYNEVLTSIIRQPFIIPPETLHSQDMGVGNNSHVPNCEQAHFTAPITATLSYRALAECPHSSI